ncbi:MAG TPA: NUDIX domain-containing protein [Methylobacter sp.]|jgi:8-oxo-dGTP diphosphatase
MSTSKKSKRFSYEFARPSVTVDAVVFGVSAAGMNILLAQRAGSPFKGDWALPGGYLQMTENLDEAVARELREETGIRLSYLEQLYTFGNMNRDPRGRVITVAYMALVRPDDHEVKAGSDARAAKWFPINGLPKLAFDHREIIDTAIRRLFSKVRYAPIGFELLPQEFTLAQLLALYETLLGRELDKRNFSKKVLSTGLLTRTGNKTDSNPPAQLYSFNASEYERLTRLGYNFTI